MPHHDDDPILLQAQLAGLQDDFDRLLEILESPQLPGDYAAMPASHFRTIVNPLLYQLEEVQHRVQQGEHEKAWGEFLAIQQQGRLLMEEALEFLGGVAIRETALDGGRAETAQQLAKLLAQHAGVDWSPAVIIGQWSTADPAEEVVAAQDPRDSLARLPIPRWDVWHLPLLAHDYGYWVAKGGHVVGLDQFVDEQTDWVRKLLDEPLPSDAEVAAFLPEILEIWEARTHASDLIAYRERYRTTLETLALRQQAHLWHLVADALAAYLVGPAYAYALLFLVLDPAHPTLEGADSGRSRYLPSDARRMAMVMYVLQAVNEKARADSYAPGPYYEELRRLTAVWEGALEATGNLAGYQQSKEKTAAWGQRLGAELRTHFRIQGEKAIERWQEAKNGLGPVLRNGADTPLQPDLLLLINAAWWSRSRYPNRIPSLSGDCERLLAGEPPPSGLNADPPDYDNEAERLLHSRLYDLETDLERLTTLFHAKEIDRADRDAVAGRLYRLLSEQDYALRNTQTLVSKGSALGASLVSVLKQSHGQQMREMQQEVLDFLGGVLMRRKALDGGICRLAEAILVDHARGTGINWASRAIMGTNPLFSPLSDMIHISFPDWDIWNLPLMGHEFGHVAAFATPAFLELLATEAGQAVRGHPQAGDWDEPQTEDYKKRRSLHIHEFFADAFAVYCLGPAFAYDMILLNLHPSEAYLPRGNHPTHAERVEVILAVLEKMNESAKQDDLEAGPYYRALKQIESWWAQAVERTGAQTGEVQPFYQLKAKTLARQIHGLLETFYRLGAQYRACDWQRADQIGQILLVNDPDLSDESLRLRDLLNIAWACRVRQPPDRVRDISKRIRPACELRLAQP